MENLDYYEILEIARGSDSATVKKAYRKMAKKYHPDANRENAKAEENFKHVNEAYQVLSDEKKRRVYDQYGKAGLEGGAGGFSGGFDDLGSVFEEVFGSAFGGGRQRGRKRTNRKYDLDLSIEMEIPFNEAIYGVKKDISFEYKTACKTCNMTGAKDGKQTACPQCQGQGQVHIRQGFMTFSQTCPQCHGSGNIVKDRCSNCKGRGFKSIKEQITIDVPAGVDSQNRLRVANKGNGDERGNRGDLYVTFIVQEDEHFIRDGDNIYLEVPIFFTQAVLGETIKIPSLTGEIELKLDVGTKDKQQFTFRNEGVANVHGHGKGDFIAQIKLKYPKSLNGEQEELLHKLQDSFGVESKPHEGAFEALFEKIRKIFK